MADRSPNETDPVAQGHTATGSAFGATQARGAVVVDEGKGPRSTTTAEKARAQVETSVAHSVQPKSGGLKPERKSITHGVRFQPGELEIVRQKAAQISSTINSYIRASVLGSDYKPPVAPELRKLLLAVLRELNAIGRNVNQIARHLNAGLARPEQGIAMLDAIRVPLIRALYKVRDALTNKPSHD